MRVRESRERRRGRGHMTKQVRNPERVGPPPSPLLSVVHVVEDRVPHLGLDVGAIVFVEASAWATSTSSNLKGFTDFEVVCKLFFVFVMHCLNDLRFCPLNWFLAQFLVL